MRSNARPKPAEIPTRPAMVFDGRLSVIPAAPPSAVEVFRVRCEARALLYAAGEFELHEAIDVLQLVAVRDGLVDELGQDVVQETLADAFHGVAR